VLTIQSKAKILAFELIRYYINFCRKQDYIMKIDAAPLPEHLLENERFKETDLSKMKNLLQAILFQIDLMKKGREFQSDLRAKSKLETLENKALKLKDIALEIKEENLKIFPL